MCGCTYTVDHKRTYIGHTFVCTFFSRYLASHMPQQTLLQIAFYSNCRGEHTPEPKTMGLRFENRHPHTCHTHARTHSDLHRAT